MNPCLFLLLALAAPAGPTTVPAAAADDRPVRALLIIGGCCHDYAKQKEILSKGISARANVQWSIFHEGDTREHRISVYANPDWWKGYDVIVHDECFGAINDVAFVESIVKPHAAGLPVVALHCAMHSYRAAKTDAYVEMLGIRSMAHGPSRPIDVAFEKVDHPITKGFKDWTTGNEELYNNIKVYDSITPLARGRQDGKETIVAWTNDFKGTRVFCTTLGHSNATVGDPRYLDLVTRGLLWSVNKLDDAHLKPAARVLINDAPAKP